LLHLPPVGCTRASMNISSLKKYVELRQSLTAEKARLEARLSAINEALGESANSGGAKRGRPPGKRGKRTMSAEARARISAAQTERWAKIRAAKKRAAK
jgi:hypothetical protein